MSDTQTIAPMTPEELARLHLAQRDAAVIVVKQQSATIRRLERTIAKLEAQINELRLDTRRQA